MSECKPLPACPSTSSYSFSPSANAVFRQFVYVCTLVTTRIDRLRYALCEYGGGLQRRARRLFATRCTVKNTLERNLGETGQKAVCDVLFASSIVPRVNRRTKWPAHHHTTQRACALSLPHVPLPVVVQRNLARSRLMSSSPPAPIGGPEPSLAASLATLFVSSHISGGSGGVGGGGGGRSGRKEGVGGGGGGGGAGGGEGGGGGGGEGGGAGGGGDAPELPLPAMGARVRCQAGETVTEMTQAQAPTATLSLPSLLPSSAGLAS